MSLFSIANFDESMTSLPSGGGECNIIEVDTLTELKAKTADEALGKIYFVKKDESGNDLNHYYVYDFTKSQFITLGEGGESVIKVYEYKDELPYPASLEEFKAMFGKIYVLKKIRKDNYGFSIDSVSTIEEMKERDVDSSKDGDVIKVLEDGNIYKYVATNNEWVIATAGTDYKVINENSYFVANIAALKDWIALGNTEESFDTQIKNGWVYPYTALITDSISLETMESWLEEYNINFQIISTPFEVTEANKIYCIKGDGFYTYLYLNENNKVTPIPLTSMKTLPALVALMYTKMHDPIDTSKFLLSDTAFNTFLTNQDADATFLAKPTTVTSIDIHNTEEQIGDNLYRFNQGVGTLSNRNILFTGIGNNLASNSATDKNMMDNIIIGNCVNNMTLSDQSGKIDDRTLTAIFSGYPMITGDYFVDSGAKLFKTEFNYVFKIKFSNNNTAKCYYWDVNEDVTYIEATGITAFASGTTYYTKEGDTYTAVTGDFVSGTTYYTQEPIYTPVVKVKTYAVGN